MATVPALPHSLLPSTNGHGPSWNKMSRKSLYAARPAHKCVRRPFGPTNTAQTPIPSCLHQAIRYIVLGCGSFVRGQKRKKVDSRPFILTSERHTGEASRCLPPHRYQPPSIPIIYVPNPFYQMIAQHREPSNPNNVTLRKRCSSFMRSVFFSPPYDVFESRHPQMKGSFNPSKN